MPLVDSQDAFMELFTPLHPHSRQVTPSFPPFLQILSSASLLWYVHLAPLWPSSSSSSSIFFLSSSACLYGSIDEWDQIQCRDEDEEEGREILHPHGQSHRLRGSEGINHLRLQTSMQQKKNGKSSCKTIPNMRSAVLLQSSTRGRHIRHLHFSYIGNIICQIKDEWIYWKGFFNNLC